MISIIASLTLGLTIPLSMVIFGDSIDSFTDRTLNICSLNLTAISQSYCPPGVQLTPTNFYTTITICDLTGSNINITPYDLTGRVRTQIIFSIIIGCVALVCGYIRTFFLNLLSERQIRIIRQNLFRSILSKDIEFFDRSTTGELNICLTDSVNKIQDGIGNKFGTAVEIISTFISCLAIGTFLSFLIKKMKSLVLFRFCSRMEINFSYSIDVTDYFSCNYFIEQSEILFIFIRQENLMILILRR